MNCKNCGKLTSEQFCSDDCFRTCTTRPVSTKSPYYIKRKLLAIADDKEEAT